MDKKYLELRVGVIKYMKLFFLNCNSTEIRSNKMEESRDSDQNYNLDGVYKQNAILLHGSKHSLFRQ